MNTVEILKAARELISDEKRWTTCAMARDSAGHAVEAWDDDAVCFCSVGAIAKACVDIHPRGEIDARNALTKETTGGHTIVSFNDTHQHAEVLALFDRAISRAEGGAA
jgi:predicted nucleotidyltransferase